MSRYKTIRIRRVRNGFQPILEWRERGCWRSVEGPVCDTAQAAATHKWALA